MLRERCKGETLSNSRSNNAHTHLAVQLDMPFISNEKILWKSVQGKGNQIMIFACNDAIPREQFPLLPQKSFYV